MPLGRYIEERPVICTYHAKAETGFLIDCVPDCSSISVGSRELRGTKNLAAQLLSDNGGTPMPKQDAARPEQPPVMAPVLPPDFPDLRQNPPSELQPPPDPTARPDQVACATPDSATADTSEDDIKDELRDKNARLREKINSVLEEHPELRDATELIALRQDLHVQVGTTFLERVQGNLQERARAIIERRPDLEHVFDD